MPVCPKCGKSFSSEQALCYHLNKKFKCGTWKCAKCSTVFDTKFALKIHSMSCGDEYTSASLPSYDVLCAIYSKSSCVFIEIDQNDVIHSISPAATSLYGFDSRDMVGKMNSNFIETLDGDLYRKTKQGESIRIVQQKLNDKLLVEHVAV